MRSQTEFEGEPVEFIDKVLMLASPRELGYEGIFETLIQFHITFGLISLIAGTTILAMTKGDSNHKKIGRVFVIAMLGNFLLGVPLGSLGQLLVGEPANFMTVIGAMFVGTVTYSGYRLAKKGSEATAWQDKSMLGLQIITASAYFYVAALMVVGTSLFGLTALTLQEATQFAFTDNRFYFFEMDVALVSTTGGTIFAVIASENFLTPLFLSAITIWFSVEDWKRIRGEVNLARAQIIQQHLTRLLVIFGAAISAVLLNTSWVSYAVCWSLPPFLALCLAGYIRRTGHRRQAVSLPMASATAS
jgi:hypothetical protein